MNLLATRRDRANLAVALLVVSAILASNLSEPGINLIGAIIYLSALVSSAITLFAVNIATYQRR